MTAPEPAEHGRETTSTTADPTLRVARPPIPGRAVRAEMAAGNLATPPIRHDDPTVTLTPQVRKDPRRTLEFGTPAPVKVTVGARPRPQRRSRTGPWIVAVVLALIVLGTVLLVMLMRGETIDGNTDLIGSGRGSAIGMAGSFPVGPAT
jgi:hypothetical protein